MKKLIIISLVFLLMILSACEQSNIEKLEISEEEKALVDMTVESNHLEEVHNVADELEPVEILTIGETDTLEIYDEKEFEQFVPQGSRIGEVSKTVRNGNLGDLITIDYRLNNHRIIVEYFENGFMRKSNLNRETGIFLMNDNGDYHKDYFEHFDTREEK